MNTLDTIEAVAIDIVAKIAPWAAPIPTAFLVGRSTVEHLQWPLAIGIIAAIIVESLGLATTATSLELYQYNQGRRKSDPPAPFQLSVVLVAFYFIVATGLTVALDIFPALARYAPAIFPALSLTGVLVLALRLDQRRRAQAFAVEKAERKERRQVPVSNNMSNFDKMHAGRKTKLDNRLDTLLDIFTDSPGMPIADAARQVGVSRQTVYSYLDQLEQKGQIHRNGHGVEVIQK